MSDTAENSTADAVGTSVGSAASSQAPETGSPLVKRGLADMLKGGVIMDVVTPEQARSRLARFQIPSGRGGSRSGCRRGGRSAGNAQ